MTTYDYDLFVIGSGPAGHRATIQAAKLDKKVAVAERKAQFDAARERLGEQEHTLREVRMAIEAAKP